MPRDPLAWQPLLRHWTRCVGEGDGAVSGLGDLAAIEGLDLAGLLPGGPGWADVQRCLRHDPEGAFRCLYYGLALRGLEALPAPEQLVPADSGEAPQVTVLIPVHNQWPLTLNCLRSLVAAANTVRFEVILADDASSDATTQLGRQLPWLRIWRSEQNQGFLDTCNAAAELARGEVLLLLNNDTLVGEHCLEQLLASLERHPQAGVVGAAVWGADGRPLEVGGIVWSDGEVWNHGRGFPPEHWFALAYERQCDYVSGCALAIRRSLWEELRGFDPRYRPAYCEDTDLCLRVWQAGHTVLVQPQARILHLEGLSHSRRTDTGLKQHQIGNLERLRREWQQWIEARQPSPGTPWLVAADRSLQSRPPALLGEPDEQKLELCRQRGFQPMAWQEHTRWQEQGVCCLPREWPGLDRWIADQLNLAAVGPGAEAKLPFPDGTLPVASLPGWDRQGVRVLANSKGLEADGWIVAGNRLLLDLDRSGGDQGMLELDLYLPEGEDRVATQQVRLLLASNRGCRSLQMLLQPGINAICLPWSCDPVSGTTILQFQGEASWSGENPSDYRALLVVLARLEWRRGEVAEANALGE